MIDSNIYQYVETRDNGLVWYKCKKCGTYMHDIERAGFGRYCPSCEEK